MLLHFRIEIWHQNDMYCLSFPMNEMKQEENKKFEVFYLGIRKSTVNSRNSETRNSVNSRITHWEEYRLYNFPILQKQ